MLDSRLVEYVLALPWQQRATGSRKGILKKAMQGRMPSQILQKKSKRGDWTHEIDDLLQKLCRQNVPEPLANHSGMMQRYIDFGKTKVLVDRYLAGHYDDTRIPLWHLVTLDRWLSVFTQGAGGERRNPQEEKVQFSEAF